MVYTHRKKGLVGAFVGSANGANWKGISWNLITVKMADPNCIGTRHSQVKTDVRKAPLPGKHRCKKNCH